MVRVLRVAGEGGNVAVESAAVGGTTWQAIQQMRCGLNITSAAGSLFPDHASCTAVLGRLPQQTDRNS